MSNEAIEVREAGRNNAELLFADVVNSFVVNLDNAIRIKAYLNTPKPENLP